MPSKPPTSESILLADRFFQGVPGVGMLLAAVALASGALAATAEGSDAIISAPAEHVAGNLVAEAANQTGIELFQRLAAARPAGNLVLSPYAIEVAFALAYAGADGATRAEMGRALHLPDNDNVIREALVGLNGAFKRMVGDSSGMLELHLANRLYGPREFGFRDSFLHLLRDGYAAPFEPVDFADALRTRRQVNNWVADQTRDKIRELIPEGGVSAQTKLMLVNALYLKAQWSHPFEERDTAMRNFYIGGTSGMNVHTMEATLELEYHKAADFAVLTLPYRNEDLRFVILLPDARNGITALAEALTPGQLRPNTGGARLIHLYLPKFRLENPAIALEHELQAMGMKTAFDQPRGSADFSRAAPREPRYLALSSVFHRAFIAVDEAGTEAAAGNFVRLDSFGVSATPPRPLEIHVDHPFIFAIQERVSGAILFLGWVNDPR